MSRGGLLTHSWKVQFVQLERRSAWHVATSFTFAQCDTVTTRLAAPTTTVQPVQPSSSTPRTGASA